MSEGEPSLFINVEGILDARKWRQRMRKQPAEYKCILSMSERQRQSEVLWRTYIDRLDCTGTEMRSHSVCLENSILCQQNVPTAPSPRKTHRISNKCDPVSRVKWEWLYDVQGPLGRLVADLYHVWFEPIQFVSWMRCSPLPATSHEVRSFQSTQLALRESHRIPSVLQSAGPPSSDHPRVPQS